MGQDLYQSYLVHPHRGSPKRELEKRKGRWDSKGWGQVLSKGAVRKGARIPLKGRKELVMVGASG